ncbi:hypothetical protein NA57DRAFT_22523, partial [Rhizodiscina lignyota]
VLQDPSVAGAPIEKRIAFLQSKNLTQEEVDVSLARAGGGDDTAAVAAPTATNPPSHQYRQPPPPPAGYGSYPGYWPQQPPPPPEVPKRDWRDWFIMATVMGGVGYGLYFTAKRYIIPLIAPPTPPQLESDKAHVDASFERAFALLDQLSTDTATLKDSEEQRTSKLDAALLDLEETVKILKDADRRRDDDARRTADEVRGLRDLIPKALDANKESQESRLRELGTELKSLKTLVGNRIGGPRPGESAVNAGALRSQSSLYGNSQTQTQQTSQPNGTPASTAQPSTPSTDVPAGGSSSSPAASNVAASEVPRTSSPYGRLTNGKAAIPAWQMAAAKQTQEEKKDTSESGTVTETT